MERQHRIPRLRESARQIHARALVTAKFGLYLGLTLIVNAIATVRVAAGRQAAYGRGRVAAACKHADVARQAPKRRALLRVLGVLGAVVTHRRGVCASRARVLWRGRLGGIGGSRRCRRRARARTRRRSRRQAPRATLCYYLRRPTAGRGREPPRVGPCVCAWAGGADTLGGPVWVFALQMCSPPREHQRVLHAAMDRRV
jgi:hypothetical protein